MTSPRLEALRKEWMGRVDALLDSLIPEEELRELDEAFGEPTPQEKASAEAERQEIEHLQQEALKRTTEPVKRKDRMWAHRKLMGGR